MPLHKRLNFDYVFIFDREIFLAVLVFKFLKTFLFIFQTDSEYGRDSSNLKKYETEVENITKQLSNMNYEDGSFEEMEENYRNVKHETNSIKTQVDTMGARYPWLDFRYSGNNII